MLIWLRRLAWVAPALLLLLALVFATTPWTVPALVRDRAQQWITQSTGRAATLGPIAFNPLSLRLRVDDLRLRNAGNTADSLRVASAELRLAWRSVWSGKLQIDALTVEKPQLWIVREPSGRLDLDDVLKRLQGRPSKPGAPPPAFALRDLRVKNGSVTFVDQAAKVVTRLTDLDVHLPAISTLPGQNGRMQLRSTAKLDGATVQLNASGTPFAGGRALDLNAELQSLALAPFLPYQPAVLPVRLQGGTLSARLQASFVAARPRDLDIHGMVQVRDGALQNRAGQLAAWKSMDLRLAHVQPLQRRADLASVRIAGLVAEFARNAQGLVGFGPNRAAVAVRQPAVAPVSTTVAASPGAARDGAPAAPAAAPGWRVHIGTLDLAGSHLRWRDTAVQPAVDWNFDAPQLRVTKLGWPLDAPAPFEADIAGPQGLQLRISGQADAQQAQATLAATHLDPRLAAAYAATALGGLAPPRGLLNAQATLDWRTKAARLNVDVRHAHWTGFAFGPAGGGLQAQDITLSGTQLHWAAQPRTLLLDVGRAQIDGFATGQNAALRAAQLSVSQAHVDLAAHTASVGEVQIMRPQASVARDPTGQWSFRHWLPQNLLRAPPGAGAPPSTAPPWRIQVQQAQVQGGRFYLADTRPKRPVVVAFTGVDLGLHDATWPQTRATGVTLSAHVSDELPTAITPLPTVAPGAKSATSATGTPALVPVAPEAAPASGTLRFSGLATASPFTLRGKLDAQDLPAQIAGNYLPARVNAEVLRAQASATGNLAVNMEAAGPSVHFDGQARLNHFMADTLVPRERLLGWNSLELGALRIDHTPRPGRAPATTVDVGQAALRDFYARVVLDPNAKLNLAQVFNPMPSRGAAAPAAPVAGTAAAKAAGSDLRIAVGGITLAGGRVDYTDHFVKPNYSTSLSGVEGSIGAFSSANPKPAPVDLRGTAESTAPVTLSGMVNPLTKPPVLDLRGKMSGLQLAPLSPYSGRYAGYNIKRGVLSMDVHYTVNPSGQLKADNQLVLNQLTFGSRVDSPEATKLPVLLAVDLLKDSRGNIALNIPISGSLNDPEFSLGAVITKAVVNLIARAITAPFSLLGHMFAGDATAEQLSHIAFIPGTAELRPGETVKLQDIAKALLAKPQLILTITGEADPDAERAAYRQAHLDQQLLAAWKRDLPRAEAYANAKTQTVPPAERAKALATVYRQTPLPDKPRDALGLPKTLPEDAMQRLLLQNIAASDDRMQALAMQRAVTLRAALETLGVPGARQFIAAPALVNKPPAGWTPQASLSLTLP